MAESVYQVDRSRTGFLEELPMRIAHRRRLLPLLLLLALVSVAPAPPASAPAPSPPPSPLAVARYEAALKQYDETWVYYQQARIDSYQVYVWSCFILDARRDMANTADDRLAALQEHLDRMNRLEQLITKIRKIGFGRSYDVGASLYYRLEAESWLVAAKARKP
jgi:hypothetical protein